MTQQVYPLLQVLTLGTLFNGLMGVPYQMQLAHGWTSLTIYINIVAVALFVPALFFCGATIRRDRCRLDMGEFERRLSCF